MRITGKKVLFVSIAVTGFIFSMVMYFTVIFKRANPVRSETIQHAWIGESVVEALFFGFGLAFCIIYGYELYHVDAGSLKNRCIAIWLALSYFFISWFPHGAMHTVMTVANPNNYIYLEVFFHWPNAISAGILCWFQFDVLWLSYVMASNKRQLLNWDDKVDGVPQPWYKQIKYQALMISFFVGCGWVLFGAFINPYPKTANTAVKVFFCTIYIVNGLQSGFGAGFLYAGLRIIRRLPNPVTRRIGLVCTICIAYIMTIAVPHPILHAKNSKHPTENVIVEYLMHFSMMAATSFLGFYQFRFLQLAVSGRLGLMLQFKQSANTEMHTRGNSSSTVSISSV